MNAELIARREFSRVQINALLQLTQGNQITVLVHSGQRKIANDHGNRFDREAVQDLRKPKIETLDNISHQAVQLFGPDED